MGTTLMRRAVLGALSLSFLLALAGRLAAQGKPPGGGGGSPPPDPAIAFWERTSRNVYLRVMNADGSNVRTVVTGGRNDSILEPCWSPDASRLAFCGSLSGNRGLWVVNAGGTGLQRIVSFTVDLLGCQADWSSTAALDGLEKLAFVVPSSVPDCSDLYVVNPDGSSLQLLEPAAEAWSVGWNWDATALVTANGYETLVLKHLGVSAGALIVTGETWLTPSLDAKFDALGANTSDRIAYEVCCVPNALCILDLGVSPPAESRLSIMGFGPSFSPDDTRLVYERNGRIYTCSANGTGETQIRVSGKQPCWRRN